MAGDKLGHAAQQEALDSAAPMRTDDDQIGTPICSVVYYFLSDVAHLDRRSHLESCTAHLLPDSLNQFTGRLF